MEITLNDKTKTVTDQLSVQSLLDQEMPGPQKGIAVALNHSVIPRSEWTSRIILQNDHVLIIKATQGG